MNKIFFLTITFLFFTSCSDDQVVTEYYENGLIKSKYTLVNGNISGDYITYFRSGEIQSIVQYENNIRNGFYKEFYKNGQLKVFCNIENNLREGVFLGYDSLGNLDKKGKIIHDKFNSFFKTYYSNGNLNKIMLMYNDTEVYSLSNKSFDTDITKSENYINLITTDTIKLGSIYEGKFILHPKNYQKIYFIEGNIDAVKKYTIHDTLKICNQINDSTVVFKKNALKKGRNYWSGILYGIKKYSDTILIMESNPIQEQFYVK